MFLLAQCCASAAPVSPAQSASGSAAPVLTRTIYLVRHGNYDYSAKPADDEGSLNALGIAQARLVAARLSGTPVTFTSLLSSTLPRARQSAQIIQQSLPQLKLEATPLLRECMPRTWRVDAIKDKKPADLAAAEAQLDEAFAKYFIPARGADQHDIVVCHGNVIRYFVMKALQVDTQAWLGLSVAHCSLTVIQVTSSGAFRVLSVGDIGHIPANLQSGTGQIDPQLVNLQ